MVKRKGSSGKGASLGSPGISKKNSGRDEGGGDSFGLGASGKFQAPDSPKSIGKARGNVDVIKATTQLTPGGKIPHQVGASGEPTSSPILVQGDGNTLGGFFPTNAARNQQDRSVKSRTT